MSLPSLAPYIGLLAIVVAGFGAWTVHRFQLEFWHGLTLFLAAIALLAAAFLAHWRIRIRSLNAKYVKCAECKGRYHRGVMYLARPDTNVALRGLPICVGCFHRLSGAPNPFPPWNERPGIQW